MAFHRYSGPHTNRVNSYKALKLHSSRLIKCTAYILFNLYRYSNF